jgi:hypothetical protein
MNSIVQIYLGLGILLFLPVFLSGKPADSEELAFSKFVALALRRPSEFGFKDKEELEKSFLGHSYGFFSKSEWESFARNKKGISELSDPNLAPEKVYEVNTALGETRCTFVVAKQPGEESFKPVLLGRVDIAEKLRFFKSLPNRGRLVLLLDASKNEMFYVDVEKPTVFLRFK